MPYLLFFSLISRLVDAAGRGESNFLDPLSVTSKAGYHSGPIITTTDGEVGCAMPPAIWCSTSASNGIGPACFASSMLGSFGIGCCMSCSFELHCTTVVWCHHFMTSRSLGQALIFCRRFNSKRAISLSFSQGPLFNNDLVNPTSTIRLEYRNSDTPRHGHSQVSVYACPEHRGQSTASPSGTAQAIEAYRVRPARFQGSASGRVAPYPMRPGALI